MNLRDYRLSKGLTRAEMARRLGIEGVNPSGTYVRIEVGSRQADAVMIERIIRLTDRVVSAADMHETRLCWLRSNRPDKFSHDAPVAAVDPSRPAEACALQPGEALCPPGASPGDLSSEAA